MTDNATAVAGNGTALTGVDEPARDLDRCIVVDCRQDLDEPQAGAGKPVQQPDSPIQDS